ncbi:HMA2 domain-containing protein [Ectothiorhodospira magna]|nr:hypothetical protein [Ectothiorhodospira magna]
MNTSLHIVASIPGRLRIKGEALRREGTRTRLAQDLSSLDGVTDLRPNPQAGSLVVHYDRTGCTKADMEARIHHLIAQHGSVSAASGPKSTAPRSGQRRRSGQRSLRMRVNRVSKIGMLVSLAASLAVAELRPRGWKHWHVTTGWGFVACLAVHLLVYRRHLLR